MGSIYGLEYWTQTRHPSNGQKLRLCWGLLTAGMMLVVLARCDCVVDGVGSDGAGSLFPGGDGGPKTEARRVAWIYLIATHVGTLSLFALFALLHAANGSFDLWNPSARGYPRGLRRRSSSRA